MSFIVLFLLLFSVNSFGNELTAFCPSVAEIKRGQLGDWIPLTIELEELASDEDVQAFRANIQRFQIAIWNEHYLENGHCFYAGDHLVFQKLVLAQDAWRPILHADWNWVKQDSLAECGTNVLSCGFVK